VTNSPPTTFAALTRWTGAPRLAAVTVSIGERLVVPLSDAEIAAVPHVKTVTGIVALVEPACTSTDVCTVATAGLLLDMVTLEPPAGAASGHDSLRAAACLENRCTERHVRYHRSRRRDGAAASNHCTEPWRRRRQAWPQARRMASRDVCYA
jgi:hypothetical protein